MEPIFFYRNPDMSSPSGQGPLGGLKIAVQPTLSVAGWPTEAGSQALIGYQALEDATVVERLQSNGAALIGATRVSEFGFGLRGNQAGKAIQQQQADAELVIDMGGEARLAAARVGICGFKASYGLIPRLGLVGLIPSMEACGILAADPKTIRAILPAIAGPDERDFSLPAKQLSDFSVAGIDPGKTTLGVIVDVLNELSSPERQYLEKELAGLKKMGFSIRELSFPEFSRHLLVHRIVGSVEASSCTGRYDSVRYGNRAPGVKNWNEMYLQSRGAAFGTLLKSYLFQGAFFQFERYQAYEAACRLRGRLLAEMDNLTAQADFLLLPTRASDLAQSPDTLADLYAQAAHTAFANVSGQPALHLPALPGDTGPGFQLSGPRLADARLLALGDYLLTKRQRGE